MALEALPVGCESQSSVKYSMSLTFSCLYLDSDLLMKRAEKIELTLFEDYGGVTDGYKNKVRSLILNLKNKRNPGLRESVVSGELSIKELCTMSIEVRANVHARLAFPF